METKRSKRYRLMNNIGKLVLDATKLSFASLVLGSIIRGELSQSTILFVGIIVSGIGAIVGIFLTTIGEEK